MRNKITAVAIVLVLLFAGSWYVMNTNANNPQIINKEKASSSSSFANKNPKNRAKNSGLQGGKMGGQNAIPVRVAAAKVQNFSIYYKALGTVTPQNIVNVKARVSGQLVAILFNEGAEVKKNDVLAKIDDRGYQIALSAAYGALLQSKAQLKNAELDLLRYQDLLAQDSIAKQTLDTQQALVAQYAAQVKVNQAKYDEAKLNLSFTDVRAPISGRLGLKQVDIGNLVGAGDANPLAVITQTAPIMVQFSLPEREIAVVIAQYRSGEKLEVTAFDRDEQKLLAQGVLHSFDNQIDPATATLKFKAQFANEDESLFANQFVNIKLKAYTLKDAVLLPADVILHNENKTYVYVVENDKVRIQHIKTGVTDNGKTVIVEGIKAGDKVVLEGTDRLRDGADVEIVAVLEEGNTPAEASAEAPAEDAFN